MTTKKKGYVKPIIATEEFVPQEYVAVCLPEKGVTEYYLACDGTSGDGQSHRADGCLNPQAYEISVDTNGYIVKIYERPNSFFGGGNASNITVNGAPAATMPLTDINGEYALKWETTVWSWSGQSQMIHTGTIKLSTLVNVNLS